MPTTQVAEITASVDTIAARTDSGGSPVTPDWSAEEKRMANSIFSEGVVSPVDAWECVAGGGGTMNVIVGSGGAKTDLAFVQGQISGQGGYLVRLDQATDTLTLDAPPGTNARRDEIYLVVYDDAYDTSGFALPRLAVRKGDVSASAPAPGPDSSWDAYLLLATILIESVDSDITTCTFTDERVFSSIFPNAVDTDAIQDNSVTFGKLNSFNTFTRTSSGEFSNLRSLTSSYSTIESIFITIPSDWVTYELEAFVSCEMQAGGTGIKYAQIRLVSDGLASAGQNVPVIPAGRGQGSLGQRRTNVSGTGSKTISLEAQEILGTDIQIDGVYLFVRATRLT